LRACVASISAVVGVPMYSITTIATIMSATKRLDQREAAPQFAGCHQKAPSFRSCSSTASPFSDCSTVDAARQSRGSCSARPCRAGVASFST
jgi:hypothetical protein